jgi:hypothetical protein
MLVNPSGILPTLLQAGLSARDQDPNFFLSSTLLNGCQASGVQGLSSPDGKA